MYPFFPEPYELPVLLPRPFEQEGMGRVILLFPPERSGIFSEALHVCVSVGLCVCVAVWHWVSSEGNLLKISLLFSRTVVTLSTLSYHKRKRCTNVTKPVIKVDFLKFRFKHHLKVFH